MEIPEIVKELREEERKGLLKSSYPLTSVRSKNEIARLYYEREIYKFLEELFGIGVIRKGRLVFCNKRLGEIFGYKDVENLYGKDVSQLFPENYRELKDKDRSTLKGKKFDGERILLDVFSFPLDKEERIIICTPCKGDEVVKSLLKCIREVDRLIAMGKSTEEISKSACKLLLDTGKYMGCAIAFIEGKEISPLVIEGKYPLSKSWTVTSIEKDFILALVSDAARSGRNVIVIEGDKFTDVLVFVEFKGKVVELLRVLVRKGEKISEEEKKLLLELAKDLWLAKKGEEVKRALEESERLFRILVKSSPVGICIYSLSSNRIVYANPSMCKLMGLDKVESKEIEGIIRKTKGKTEIEISLPTGRKKLQVSTVPARYGDEDVIIAMVMDLTAEREVQEKYRILFEANPQMVMYVNKRGEVVEVNARCVKRLGYKRAELIGKKFDEIFVQKEKAKEFLKDMLDGKRMKEAYLDIITREGKRIVGKVHGKCVMVKYGVEGAIISITDVTREKDFEKRIRETEEMFRKLSSSAHDGIVMINDKGEVTFWNKAAERIFGYKEDEILGKRLYETLIPEMHREAYMKGIKRFEKTGRGKIVNKTIELVAKRKDGKLIPVELSISSFKLRNKWHAVGIVRDISERKKMEETLKEREEQIRSIVQSTTDAVITIDENGIITFWNNGAKEMFGYSEQEIIGKPVTLLVHEANLLERKSPLETTGRKNSGKEFPIELTVGKWEARGKTYFTVIMRDVTERKKMEKELKETHSQMETLLNAAADGIRIVRRDFKVVALNETMAKLAGVKKEEAIGMNCREMFGSPFCGTEDCLMERIIRTGKRIQTRMLRIRADGKTIPCLYVGTPIRDKKGRIIGIVEDFRDISKIEEMEMKLAKAYRKLEKQNERLKRLNNLQRIFLNITSHELRTPMTAIKGYAQLLSAGMLGKVTDEQKNALDTIRRNIDRLDRLINDILDISRLESGTIGLEPEQCDISEIVKDAVDTMKFAADAKGIEIVLEIDGKMPVLYADKGRLKQVFLNLLSNAIKFSERGKKVIVRLEKERNHVVASVKDFGRGIPKSKQKKIFEPFYQVDRGMDRKYGGLGLGLSITRAIVKAHGGSIEVESEVGKGSTFYVRLPIKASLSRKISIFQ